MKNCGSLQIGAKRSVQSGALGRAMGRLAKTFVLGVSLIGLAAWGGDAMAATRTSTAAGGNWNAAGTWVNGIPASTDNVVIATTGAGAVNVNVQASMVNLTVNSGSVLTVVGGSNFRLRPTGTTSISGTLNIGTTTSSYRFSGAVTLNAGGVWTNTGNTPINFRGGLTNNGGTFTAGTGIQSFTNAAQAIGGTSPISIPNLTVTTIALTNNGNLTVPTALAGSGSLINSATGTLNLGGTSAITTLTANAAGNTVNYTGAAQTVKATAYSNLGLGGSGAKTLTGVSTVGGNLTMSGTASATAAAALTVGGNFSIGASNTFGNGANALNVAGNFDQNGTFTAGTGVVTLNGGAAVQTISGTGPLGFANLTVNNTGGITLARNVTVASAIIGAVNLTSTCPTNYTLTSNNNTTVMESCPPPPTVVSINLASTNPTTAGSAVAWTVVFSRSVTGVVAANFAFVQTGGVTGATITSVAGGGTTWTVNANTGAGAGTLGLNMVNVTGIAPAVSTVMPFVGASYTVYPPLTCLSDSFTGTNNSVPNSINWDVQAVSGTFTPVIFGNRLRITDITNNVATRATNKNIFPFGNNVVVAEFDYWSYGGTLTGADGIAVTFSDPNTPTIGANNPPTAGGFGGSLGYANRDTVGTCNIAGFSGGWIGVGIDDYGNYSNPTECRNGGTGLVTNAVAIRGSGSGATSPSASNYAYLTGTAALGANGVASGTTVTAYRYRITLDSATDLTKVMVKVEQDTTGTGANYLPLFSYDLKPQITAGTQAALPSQLQFTFTGSTGASTDYHEVDNLSICAALVASALNHVAINAPATDMALTAVPVTISPHDAAHVALNNAGTINLSTSTGLGDWTIGSGTGTLTPGAANSGLATYTFGPGESSATLNFTYQTAGTVTLNVGGAGGSDLLLNTPPAEKANTITFAMPGFVFTNSACVNNIAFGAVGQTCTIPSWSPQIAGQDLTNIYITAVNASGVPTRLSSNQVRTRSMQFGLTCHDPLVGAGMVATFTATANPFNACEPNGAMPTAATWTAAANISFPAGSPSSGPFIFNYPDVGKVELWMLRANTTSTGSSGPFVVKPGDFVLSAIQQTAAPNLPNPAAANAAGAAFVKAGEPFSATVTAMTCPIASATCTVPGAVTPNYGMEVAPESVKLTSALAPGLTANPAVVGTFGAFTAGVATGTAFSWGEVGIITLTPSVASGSYLGAGDVAGTNSGNVGRFYPDHFDTAVVATATGPMPCPTGLTCPALYNGFVYSGQPFSVQVTAKNAGGGPTTNYNTTSGFANNTTLSAWGAPGTTNAVTGAGALGVTNVASTAFGLGTSTEAAETYTFTATPTAPTDVYVRADEAAGDAVSSLRAVAASSVEGGVKVVSGRVKVANAYGSELLPLNVQAAAQYFTATGWVNSSTDSTTSFAVGSIAWTSVKGPLIPGNLGVTVVADACAANVFCNGVKRITLTNAAKATGSADICLNSPVFLQGTPACAAGTPGPNAGRATFGVYQGRKEFIYLRENY